MRLFSKNSISLPSASSVTSLVAASVSTGPPIKTMATGWWGDSSWASNDTAANTGTTG